MTRLIQRLTLQDPNTDNGGGGGQYVPADITPGQDANQNQQDPNKVPDSVQKRFDELTAQLAEARRQAQAALEANQQLMPIIAQANQPKAPAAPTPPSFEVAIPEGMDPQLAALLKSQADQFNKAMQWQAEQFKQQLGQVQGQVAQSIDQVRFQAKAATEAPEVTQLAQKLLSDWRRDPSKGGWNESDAITFAKGILAEQGKLPAPQAARQTQQPARDPATGHFTASVPDGRQGNVLPEPLADAVLAKMTPAQQEAYWADRLQKTGGIDQPIVY